MDSLFHARELELLTPLLVQLRNLELAGVDRGTRITFLLPPELLPGVRVLWSRPVERGPEGIEPGLVLRPAR